jgi:hypothetical protein
VPASGSVSPSRMSIVVDFPAPFGTEQRDHLAGANRQVHAAHRVDDARWRPERLHEARELDDG